MSVLERSTRSFSPDWQCGQSTVLAEGNPIHFTVATAGNYGLVVETPAGVANPDLVFNVAPAASAVATEEPAAATAEPAAAADTRVTLPADDPTTSIINEILRLANATRTTPLVYSSVLSEVARRELGGEDGFDVADELGVQANYVARGTFTTPQALLTRMQARFSTESFRSIGLSIINGRIAVVLSNDLVAEPEATPEPASEEAVGLPVGASEETPTEVPAVEEPSVQLTFPFSATMISGTPPDLLDAPAGNYLINMLPGETITVLAQNADGTWFQIADSANTTGWVPAWGVVLP